MKPRRFKNASYAEVPKNIQKHFNDIYETHRGLYIHGKVGSGKTHIAYAIWDEWNARVETFIKAGKLPNYYPRAEFYNMTELLYELRNSFKNGTTEDIFDSLIRGRCVLFIDDLGAEKVTEWVEETIYLLVNRRYEDEMPIIFTSNYSIPELSERVGDRICSRIVEMCDIVKLEGEDRRINKK